MPSKLSGKTVYQMHARICKVLSNPKRLEIIHLLRDGERAVGDLVDKMGAAKANVSQQLAVMAEKGILESRREGQYIYYRLAYPKMLKAYDLLREILFEQLQKGMDLAQRLKKASRGK